MLCVTVSATVDYLLEKTVQVFILCCKTKRLLNVLPIYLSLATLLTLTLVKSLCILHAPKPSGLRLLSYLYEFGGQKLYNDRNAF